MDACCKRFAGKAYDFAMYADTKKEAQEKAKKFVGRPIFRENKNKALYRITRGIY